MITDRLRINHVLGVPHLDVALGSMVIVAGPNGSGKTSTLEAMRYAYLGDLPRVRLKKDAGALVTDGAKAGSVSLAFGEEEFTRSLPDGKGFGNLPLVFGSRAAQFAVGGLRFSGLAQAERRALLSELTGVRGSGEWVGRRLAESGVPVAMIEQIRPLLRSGFDAASDFCSAQATERRGEWRGITGEVYGCKKAEGWSTPMPAPLPGDLDILSADLRALERRQRDVREKIGARRATGIAPTDEELQQLQADISEADGTLSGWQAELPELERKAQPVDGTQLPCPCCNAMLRATVGNGSVTLRRSTSEDLPPSADDVAALQAMRSNIASATRALASARADLAAKKAQRDVSKALGEEGDSLEQLQSAAAELDQDIEHVRGELEQLQANRRAISTASEANAKAAAAHAAAEQWKIAAEALAPNGLPAELLSQALGPFLAKLAEVAQGWRPIAVGEDMALTYGGRPFELCSESEQWRVDAAITIAIARLAGVPTVLLDRFDVLDTHSRGPTLSWLLDAAYAESEPVQIVLGGTLKTAPSVEGMTTIWLGNSAEPAAKAA